jgi:hypothetical protein
MSDEKPLKDDPYKKDHWADERACYTCTGKYCEQCDDGDCYDHDPVKHNQRYGNRGDGIK